MSCNDKIKIELVKRSTGLLITLKYTFNTLEKIEDELSIMLPDKVIRRMDLDTTRSKNAYENIINE